jgi:multisubunit Na+/H+ antiporter MnhB subunit
MIARLVALVAAIAALVFGLRIYSYSGGLDSPDLRTDLALLAAAILLCFVALKIARKKTRPGPRA